MPQLAAQSRVPSLPTLDAEHEAWAELERICGARENLGPSHSAPMADAEIDALLVGLIDEPKIPAHGKSGNRWPEEASEGIESDTPVKGKNQNLLNQNSIDQTETDLSPIHHSLSERSVAEGPKAPNEAKLAHTEGREAAEGSTVASSPYRNRIELADVDLAFRPVRRPRRGEPPYKDARLGTRIILAHGELLRRGPVIAFTVNVRSDWAQKAIASGIPANFLSKRILREFRKLGLEWQGWFAIEIERGLFHLHGACLGTPEQAKTIRLAWRRAVGEWKKDEDGPRQYQTHTSVDPDFGWATYSAKDFGKAIATKLAGPGPGMGRLPFTGKHFSVSREIMGAAKDRYNEERGIFIDNYKQSKQSVCTDILSIVDVTKQISDSLPALTDAPDKPNEGLDHALRQPDAGRIRSSVPRATRSRADHSSTRNGRLSRRRPSGFRTGRDHSRRRTDWHAGLAPRRCELLARPP